MTMRRSILAALAAALVSLGAFGATEALATEYAHHVNVASGANFFGPFVTLISAETIGTGNALGCAGIRGIAGVVCEQEPGTRAIISLSSYVSSEPYIHNHSTFAGVFNGSYF
jgi:hypothetical protein